MSRPDGPNDETPAPVKAPSSHPTVVGIGASAGALAALRELFKHVPADSGLSYVVVVHLSPEHESHLAQLLQSHVEMPVEQVQTTVGLEPNRVYVIPPNANLSAVDTHLRLSELEEERNERAPIDHFLRTLSRTHDGNAIGIILSGTGGDGTLGAKAIKEKGGLMIVQDPKEAEYGGMPQSAIATGLIDLVLPIARIPEAVLRFARTEPRVGVPPEYADLETEQQRVLRKLFAQLRAQTGRDFSRYKRATILRRIARRMQLRQVEELPAYFELLGDEPGEARALADDLLITVTRFFRDPEVFQSLANDVVPRLFDGKDADGELRIWSVGCATGEEAYSMAMLLMEEAGRRDSSPRIQIFASDLHEESLQKARGGFYAGEIESEVEPERLKRFFVREEGGYRVRKKLRELVIFAPHDLLSDPPFSRLDMIICRNLLIYLRRDVQRDVIDLFHYALVQGGELVLGSSETIEGTDLFRSEDKTQHRYRRRNVPSSEPRLPVFPFTRLQETHEPRDETSDPVPVAYGTLHQRMLERYGPPSLLVSPDDRVVHLSGRAGRYLVHPEGELTSSVYKLVREELSFELREAIDEGRETGEPRRTKSIDVRFNGTSGHVIIDTRPAPELEEKGFVLVMFEEHRGSTGRVDPAGEENAAKSVEAGAAGHATDANARQLENELELTRRHLQTIIERYESSQEEMTASNEELQSTNEELRSTMEELETSKEELQSMNEELQTVNQENRHKVEELAQLSSDLQNFLTATDIPTLFLDRSLRIMRFTPSIGELFNVRVTDSGRPLSDLTHRLDYDRLRNDAAAVLKRLVPVEREIRDDEGRSYLTRVRPYRSTQDRIEGVVITFVDISRRKRAEEQLRRSEEFHRHAVEAAHVGTWDIDLVEGESHFSPQMAMLMDYRPDRRTVTNEEWIRTVHAQDTEKVVDALAASKRNGHPLDLEFRIRLSDGTLRWLYAKGGPNHGEEGGRRLHGAAIDVTELKEAQEALRAREEEHRKLNDTLEEQVEARTRLVRAQEERYRRLVQSAAQVTWTTDPGGRFVEDSPSWREFTGQSREEWMGDGWWTAVHPDDRAEARSSWRRSVGAESAFATDLRLYHAKTSVHRWTAVRAVPLPSESGEVRGWFGMHLDIDDLKRAEERIREMASRLTIAEQKERTRLAQFLHDDLQQLLYAIQMKLAAAHRQGDAGDVEALLGQAHESLELLGTAVAKTRQLSVDLNPPVLDDEGLVEALQWLETQMRELHGLEVEVKDSGGSPDVDSRDLRILLFQAARELLFNVAKHADTDRAEVRISVKDHEVRMTIEDEGKGFDLEEAESREAENRGFGLFSVRERLGLHGGGLEIYSRPGEGTRVVAFVPVSGSGG